ncbi:hypothetical protein RCO48_15475 [Peribacillus frigoritolerans]|nr:hypothetical protein [Peribacillus frigoritolerans]
MHGFFEDGSSLPANLSGTIIESIREDIKKENLVIGNRIFFLSFSLLKKNIALFIWMIKDNEKIIACGAIPIRVEKGLYNVLQKTCSNNIPPKQYFLFWGY